MKTLGSALPSQPLCLEPVLVSPDFMGPGQWKISQGGWARDGD